MVKLPKFSLFLGIYIVISAYFTQQVWLALKTAFGQKALTIFFIFLCLWLISAIIYKSIKSGVDIKKLSLICAICVSGFIFALKQPYATERAHVVEYGILGWLAMRDLSEENKNILINILCAFIFVLIIGSLDEGFQKLLPWRVFEVRDIATNVSSGILGIILFILR